MNLYATAAIIFVIAAIFTVLDRAGYHQDRIPMRRRDTTRRSGPSQSTSYWAFKPEYPKNRKASFFAPGGKPTWTRCPWN